MILEQGQIGVKNTCEKNNELAFKNLTVRS